MKPTLVTPDCIRVRVSGIMLRRKDRERKVDYVRRVTEEAVREFLPGLATPATAYVEYPRDLKELLEEIQGWAKTAHDLKIARAHLARLIAKHNRQHGTELYIPPPLSRLFPDTLLRSQKWSHERRRLNAAHEQWLQGLDSQRRHDRTTDERLGIFLYVAATYGGLCIPAAVDYLAEAIKAPRPIKACRNSGLQWIDLYYEHGKFTNSTKDKAAVIYRPWLLTPMCQLAAFGFLKQRDRCSGALSSERPTSFELVADSFQQVAETELPFSSMAAFLRVAFCVAERQPGSSMSELHAEFSIGRVASLSLQPSHWCRVLVDASNAATVSHQ